jgi:hypothetical protein
VIEVPTEYVRRVYEGYIGQSTKTHGLYAKLVQDSLAPVNTVHSAPRLTFAPAEPTIHAK